MGDEWLGHIIEGAYDAAVEGGWYDWLNSLRRALGGTGAVLALLPRHSAAHRALPIACGDKTLSTGAVQHYLSQRGVDPWYQQARRQRNQVVQLDESLRRDRLDSPLAELFRTLDCHYSVGSILSTEHGHHLLGLYRCQGQSDFCRQQLRAVEQIALHLRQAMALTPFLHERIGARLDASHLASEAQPQAVVRANGTLAYANAAMEHYLCDAQTPLRFRRGRLGARQPLLQRMLERTQAAACQGQLAERLGGRLPLGSDQVTIMPTPESVLAGAALWQIQPAHAEFSSQLLKSELLSPC
ncbi:hypothetical protein Fbal_1184 [Ferrimonas balearica DSM 9799]|uniref:Uncharacterized protein n=1 Tax=Ferrimonas balearica (strain DSM 9799 / CCM 4581 / KCTC 23876 / PAT) TaxID=550540 RepID=E1SWA4_FERBD|nr:hypothetical protein [Ferrimonas balearica]ADN75393.1 hypothetical protein Fbal_1184 [Ferrimonas balearica DSM 9799]